VNAGSPALLVPRASALVATICAALGGLRSPIALASAEPSKALPSNSAKKPGWLRVETLLKLGKAQAYPVAIRDSLFMGQRKADERLTSQPSASTRSFTRLAPCRQGDSRCPAYGVSRHLPGPLPGEL
jgi:hypothetical protein